MMTKFLYKNQGPINEIFVEALKFSTSFNQPIHLVFPRKTDFHSTNIGKVLDDLFGEPVSKRLTKGEKFANLDFMLPNQVGHQSSQGIILAVYCTLDDMAKITSNSYPDSKIIYISWSINEAENWENIWKGKGLEIKYGIPNSQPILLSQNVEAALRRLTNIINLSTGLSHPSDKQQAVDEFQQLKQQGITENPEYIANWALTNGWNAEHINDLKKLAIKYLQ